MGKIFERGHLHHHRPLLYIGIGKSPVLKFLNPNPMGYQVTRRTMTDGTSKFVVKKDGKAYDLLTDLDVVREMGIDEASSRMQFVTEPNTPIKTGKRAGETFTNRYCYVPEYNDEVVLG